MNEQNGFPRPTIFCSRCLGFEACRWNGDMIREPFIDDLREHAAFITACPEGDMGLGTPRDPVRIVGSRDSDEVRLVQPATGKDCTADMDAMIEGFLSRMRAEPKPPIEEPLPDVIRWNDRDVLPPVDGFILKHRSPSCGPNTVRIYREADNPAVLRRGAGLFAQALLEEYPHLPIEDEGRLHNFVIREHWLTRVFAFARLREVIASGSMARLVDFHSDHKYLFMAYNQTGLRELGRIVASGSKKTFAPTVAAYEERFHKTLAQPARFTSVINVFQHIQGYFSKGTSPEERRYFENVIEEYRRGGLPMSVPVQILKNWAIRFEEKYILRQVFLQPYPQPLVSITDSGKGRSTK